MVRGLLVDLKEDSRVVRDSGDLVQAGEVLQADQGAGADLLVTGDRDPQVLR